MSLLRTYSLLIFLLLSELLLAQKNISKKEYHQLYKTANKLFEAEEFSAALPILLRLDTESLKPDFMVKYDIGVCYLNTKYQKAKAVPYLEYTIKKGEGLLPKAVFWDLGRLYHFVGNYEQSKTMLKRYLKLANVEEEPAMIEKANTIVQMDDFAKKMKTDSAKHNFEVQELPPPVKTKNTEHFTFITADNQRLYFSRTYLKKNKLPLQDSISKILVSDAVGIDGWSKPKEIKIISSFLKDAASLALVGLSYDGQFLFFRKQKKNEKDFNLYFGRLEGDSCIDIKALPQEINSPFYEGAISHTPDGHIFYFSSARPGGYGGKDIYKIEYDTSGVWGKAINMGPSINTKYNEDYPFIHPSGKLLYFSTDNVSNTIGGYDIVKSHLIDTIWTMPENLGFPVNSSRDDILFVPDAEGKYAYYSSISTDLTSGYNLYRIRMEESIPLTLVKGSISDANTNKPIVAKIKVYDKSTTKWVKYVYNPNPKSGKYLMIFPPGHNYDMLIEAKGYYNHVVTIHVPHQSYFYELYQEIKLKPIKIDTLKVGEAIEVNNLFYDTKKFKVDDDDEKIVSQGKDYEPLLNLVNDIISLTDSIGINQVNEMCQKEDTMSLDSMVKVERQKKYEQLLGKIDEAISMTDTVLLKKITENTIYKDKTTQVVYFNSSNADSVMETIILGGDTVKALTADAVKPIIHSADLSDIVEVKHDSLRVKQESSKIKKLNLIATFSFYFLSANYKIGKADKIRLEQVALFLRNNPNLLVTIEGHADTDGDETMNYKLSQKRGFSVMAELKRLGVNKQQFKLLAFGEPKQKEKTLQEKKKNRRVDVKIMELVDEK